MSRPFERHNLRVLARYEERLQEVAGSIDPSSEATRLDLSARISRLKILLGLRLGYGEGYTPRFRPTLDQDPLGRPLPGPPRFPSDVYCSACARKRARLVRR